MKIVGLTGGIACGKSTVAALLREQRLPVVDADQLARDVVAPGGTALEEIVALFGTSVLTSGGELDRRELGRIVFDDVEARRKLEAITHPAILLASQERFIDLSREGHDLAFYEAALLVETGGYKNMWALLVVTASLETQRARLLARDSDLSTEEADKRIASQMPLKEKETVADLIIINNGSEEALRVEVSEAVRQLREQLDG